MRRGAFGSALVAAIVFVAGACSEPEEETPAGTTVPVEVVDEIGDGEGALNLLAFAGYAEDGSTDPQIDWVRPFERSTGCDVDVRYVDSGEEIVTLLAREGDDAFDGASVPGDTTGELIASGEVAAVDPGLFPAFGQVLEPLRTDNARHYVVGEHTFGVPALYGPNLLLFDTEEVVPAPRSWNVVLEADTPYAGRIAMLDGPMAIAQAALYLSSREPGLGIEDPYALTSPQLDAATALLIEQHDAVGVYWRLFTDSLDAFREEGVVVGVAWPVTLSLLEAEERPVAAAEPVEGMTGWADTWMIAADAPHPNCMLRWMRWTLSAEIQAEMAFWYGGAPSNGRACGFIRDRLGDFADLADTLRFGRCGDEQFLASLALWRVPTVDCGDGRGRTCTGIAAWRARWAEVLAS
jgi:putative spermidine/putrescine transport system substrate-binding protein